MSVWRGSLGRSIVLFVALVGAAGAAAVLPSSCAAADSTDSAVLALENRFFFRHYEQDPVEKRLQRLELLVFGATQPGAGEERLSRLRQAISNRDRQAAEALKSRSGAGQGGAPGKIQSSAQYPSLNTLEWRILKKTFPQESLDPRLDRLEVKLFGVPSQAMSYADRIERLKRTIGIDIARAAPSLPGGPPSKARPRAGEGGADDWKQEPWTYGSPLLPDYMPPGTYRTPVPGDVPPQFAEMFRQLDRQMEQMMRMPPGTHPFNPGGGIWVFPNSGQKVRPDPNNPTPKAPKSLPVMPYNDPNSI